MEYQKIINLLGNTKNEPPQLGTRNLLEINEDRMAKIIKLNFKLQS